MNTLLWTQKLSDDQLRKMLEYADDIAETGTIRFEEARRIINAWYTQSVGTERMLSFSMDVWKEAARRWATER